eukprot:7228406-Alexandrium_andersonii.AAC.1
MGLLQPQEELRKDALRTPTSDTAGCMARRYRLQPAGHLLRVASRPGSDDHRRDGDGSQLADQWHLIRRVFGN